jgi:hypothetical protein
MHTHTLAPFALIMTVRKMLRSDESEISPLFTMKLLGRSYHAQYVIPATTGVVKYLLSFIASHCNYFNKHTHLHST